MPSEPERPGYVPLGKTQAITSKRFNSSSSILDNVYCLGWLKNAIKIDAATADEDYGSVNSSRQPLARSKLGYRTKKPLNNNHNRTNATSASDSGGPYQFDKRGPTFTHLTDGSAKDVLCEKRRLTT